MQVKDSERLEFSPHSPWSEGAAKPRGAPENIARFVAGFFEGGGPALTTVLNRKVQLTAGEPRATTFAELLESTPPPWVVAEATYQRGLSGSHWLVFPHAAALALAEALTGDGESEDLGTPHRDAAGEVVNQMLAAAGPTLMPLFARSIAFAPTFARIVGDAGDVPAEIGGPRDPLWVVSATARGDDGFRLEIVLTITQDLARQITAIGAPEPAGTAAPEVRRADDGVSRIDLIMDVTLPVAVELGRARMQIRDILKLGPGSVIELDKSAGDPVELYINDRPIAKGEVVIIDENFGVRLTSIVAASERIKTLR